MEKFQPDSPMSQIGNYHIKKVIGNGSFGTVYLARHSMLQVPVCLKRGERLPNNYNLMREFYYLKEFRNHPNIINIYEAIYMVDDVYLVMDYYPTGDLFEFIFTDNGGQLPVELSLKIFVQLINAVYYIHSMGCCHRDLKLENILLTEELDVRLGDFGFTREIPMKSLSSSSTSLIKDICGTLAYMAPELVQRPFLGYSGFKIDIWALGVILYTLIYGEMPFDDSLTDDQLIFSIMNNQPRFLNKLEITEVDQLIQSLLNKHADKRPNGLNEVLSLPLFDRFGGKECITLVNKLKTEHQKKQQQQLSEYSITKGEKAMFKDMVKLGFDKETLKQSIKSASMDPVYGTWELLKVKRQIEKSKKTNTSKRSLLRLNTKSSISTVNDDTLRRTSSIKSFLSSTTSNGVVTGSGVNSNNIKNFNVNTGKAIHSPIGKFNFKSIFHKRTTPASLPMHTPKLVLPDGLNTDEFKSGTKRLLTSSRTSSLMQLQSGESSMIRNSMLEDDDEEEEEDGDDEARDDEDDDLEGVARVQNGLNTLSLNTNSNKRMKRPPSVISNYSMQTTFSETSNGSGYVTGYSTDRSKLYSNGNAGPSSVSNANNTNSHRSDSPQSPNGGMIKRGKSPLKVNTNTVWKSQPVKHTKLTHSSEGNILEEEEPSSREEERPEEEEADVSMGSPKVHHRRKFRRLPPLSTPMETDEEGDDENEEEEDDDSVADSQILHSPMPRRGRFHQYHA